MMNKVSILVAAYNVKEYISEAMSSVVAQTLKDIEIIVVDDCSTDGTFEIISKYAEHDSRIKVVRHKENSGVLMVRQTGFKNSSGEYIMFLDGDDALALNACEAAYNAITDENVDMLEFGYDINFPIPADNTSELENNFRTQAHTIEHKVVSISEAGLLDHKETGGAIDNQMWNKIYKRDIIEKAFAQIPDIYLNMADDVFFSFYIQYYAHTYNYIPDRLYTYKFGTGMSTVAKLSKTLMESFAKKSFVYHQLSDFVKNKQLQKECESALRDVFSKTYRSIAGTYFDRVPKEQKKEFIAEMMKYGDAENFVLGVSMFLYSYDIPQERIADECADLEIFSTQKSKAKTIGVYYYRIFNGGVENVISILSDMWIKQGYNVVLFTDTEPTKDDYYINPAIKRVTLPKIVNRDFFNLRSRIRDFRAALIENDVDIMVYNGWASGDLLLDEMIIKSCGVNLMIHTHNLFCCEVDHISGEYAHFYSILPRLYAFVDSVIAISDVDAAWWSAMGFRTLKTINPIQFSLDTPVSPLNGNNILLVARISVEKQVIDAIKVAELVQKEIPNATLTIVGKGDDQNYINEVNNYIESNDLHDLVNMAGFTLDMLPYYHSADVMLSTSSFEGCPLALLEGKICGIPLVCYEIPNLDILRYDKGVTIVDQKDVKAAASAIINLLRDPELKKKRGREARESAEEFYSVDLTERWKNIFEQTLLPKPQAIPLYKLPALETATRIASDKFSNGIRKRLQEFYRLQYQAGITAELENRCRSLEEQHNTLEERNRSLEEHSHAVEEQMAALRRSETFRIGAAIVFFPRVIKLLLKKIFRR